MTSSNENIFRVTDPLCGEFTGEFPSQSPVTRSFDIYFDLWQKRLYNRDRGDFKRHGAHNDATVIYT